MQLTNKVCEGENVLHTGVSSQQCGSQLNYLRLVYG